MVHCEWLHKLWWIEVNRGIPWFGAKMPWNQRRKRRIAN